MHRISINAPPISICDKDRYTNCLVSITNPIHIAVQSIPKNWLIPEFLWEPIAFIFQPFGREETPYISCVLQAQKGMLLLNKRLFVIFSFLPIVTSD